MAKVTCQGMTTKGVRCKQTVGIVDGFCSAHRPGGKATKKSPKVAEPEFGAEYLKSLIDATATGATESSNGKTKIDFVGGQWTEVPVEDEHVVKVAREEFKKQREEAIGSLEKTGELVDPSDIFAKYDYLMKYVAIDSVVNLNLFSAYVVKVANMNYLQAGLEFKSLKSKEDELSAKSKKLTEEAHAEYGRSIPLDIQMDIDALMNEITDYKHKRGVVMAQLDWHESQMEDEPVEPVPDKPAFEDVVKGYFIGLLSRLKGVSAKALIAIGALMVLLATAVTFNMGVDKAPKTEPAHHSTVTEHHSKPVVQHKPVVDVTVPTVDNKPPSDAVWPVDGHNGAIHDDEYTHPNEETKVVAVHDGDTLWDIAKAVYGDGSKWTKIYDANKDKLVHDDSRNMHDAGHWIHAGQGLIIPQDGE